MRVALVGNQNCGKTSLFNKLTGGNQKIGNWPGVTIEKKEGRINKLNIELVDLPGVYSLSPYTEEENITRNYLMNDKPDLVLNVIDSTRLERSLYLTTQLSDLDIPMIIVLNMCDILEKENSELNTEVLSNDLGINAIKVSAKTGIGINSLLEALRHKKTQKTQNNIEKYPKIIENTLKNVQKSEKISNKFMFIERILNASDKEDSILRARQILSKLYGKDLEEVFISLRYQFISKVTRDCLVVGKNKNKISEKLDKILLNKFLAIPIFILIMVTMYFLSVGLVGSFVSDYLIELFDVLAQNVRGMLVNIGMSSWLVSLIIDGIFTGVTSVLSFLPQLAVVFMFINLLENSGYMSRVVFIFDKFMYRLGLSGKSLISFIIGSGCSVPAISATRAIEQEQEKNKTIILSPFIPCSAKLPIIALFVGYFFADYSGLITASLYLLAVFIIVICSVILNNVIFKTRTFSFVSELPDYRLPSLKYMIKDVFDKCKEFIVRAGTIILISSILIWFLSSFSFNLRFCNDISMSILAGIGRGLSWIFYPIIGESNWAVTVSAIQGIIAKEQVVSSMSIISGLEGIGSEMFARGIFSGFTPASAYAFVAFNLFSAPCLASIGEMKNELKSTKKALFAILFQIVIAWIIASIIFQVGRLFV